ncbi:hypothetical protein [Streptomyces spectabilis]|uniref:hypothetical protein n=1 Tax=Streptomyces spectabilis TaxID=68270 RepID=UPI0033D6477E
MRHKANDQGCIVYAFIETSRGLYASSSARKVDGERQWGEPVLVLDSTRDGDWSDPALTDYGYATHPKVAYRVEGTEPQDFLAYCTAREKASDRMDQRLLLLRGKGDGQIDRRYVYLNSFTDLSVSAPNNVTIAACSDNLWMIFMVDGGRLQSYSLLFDVDGVPKIYEGKKSVDLHVQSIVHSFNSGPQAISVIYTRNDGENELASCPYEYGAETHGGSYKEPVNLGVENGIHVTAQLTGDVAGHTVFTLRNDWTVLVNRRLVAKPGHEAPQEWTPPLPLFADVFGCAAPSFGVKSSTLFSWGGAGAYLRVSVQDPVTHSWRTSYVRKPPPKENAIPHEVTRYQVEVQFLDDGGQPMPEHRFHITLAAGFSSSEILHAGKVRSVHHRAEDLAAARDETAISSDANGKIVFSVLEEGLAVPSFEFYDLSRDGKPHLVGKVNPARNIEYYLSGRLDNFNATNPRGPLPRFDAEGKAILQAKFVDLNNVEHALVVATDESPKLAKVVAASCQSLVTMTGEDLPDPPSFTAHFSSPTRSEGNPQFLQMSSSPAYRESLLTGVGVFEWLSETAGDILRGIETGALRILEIACDAVNRTIQFTLDTAERLVTLTVDTYEKVAQAVSGLFNHIGAVVEDVVLWLREIFNFRAIWNTSKALAEMNRVGSDLTSQVLANTEEGITAWFADQKESIRANMTSVRKGLAGVTFSTDNAGERENLALAEIDGGSVSSN